MVPLSPCLADKQQLLLTMVVISICIRANTQMNIGIHHAIMDYSINFHCD